MNVRYCLLTNDVECHSIWHNALREETGLRVLREGMPLLLDLYSAFEIKATFFFTGEIVEKFPGVVKMVLPYKHEVASHGYSHEIDQAFDTLPLEKQIHHLKQSKQMLEDISGQEVISFRAPAGRINKDTPRALKEAGFKIDSSISSQRFDMFLSFGGIKKLNWLTAPRLPYTTKVDNLWKAGEGDIFEIPISALFLPYIGTTLRMMPILTRSTRRLLHWESSINRKPIVFLTHPNEFIDEKGEKIENYRRAKNFFSYIFRDIIRRQLKLRNLGPKGLEIYKKEIEFFTKKKYTFLTCQEYYKIKKQKE